MPVQVLSSELVEVPINSIKPHELNVNNGETGFLTESMKVNGFFGCIIVQRSTNRILAGKNRWMVAKKEGLKKVPVLFHDVDDDTAVRLMLSDNQINRMGKDDEKKLAEVLSTVKKSPNGLQGTGFDDKALKAIVKQAQRVPMETISSAEGRPSGGVPGVEQSSSKAPVGVQQSSIYPLAIVLTVKDYRRWCEFKGSRSDTNAFLALLGKCTA